MAGFAKWRELRGTQAVAHIGYFDAVIGDEEVVVVVATEAIVQLFMPAVPSFVHG